MREIFFIPKDKEEVLYKLKDNFIKKETSLKYNKKNFYSGFVKSKNVIHTPLEIEDSIPEDSIEDYISAKTYEELGLDFNIEYSIKYSKKENSTTSNMAEYDVFVISNINLINNFKSQLNLIKHIDYISATPFLMKSLYSLNFLPKDKIDCFVYSSFDDSFLSIYKNGNFLYFKSMDFSIEDLFKKFTFSHPNVIKIEDFITILHGNDDKYKESINNLYNEIGVYISDILLYVKRVYSIEIDNLYIDCDVGFRDEFYNYFQSYVDVSPKKFEFDYKFVGDSPTHLIKLLFLSSINFDENGDIFNFTIFKKEKHFLLKPAGKFVLATIGGVLISLLYPLFNYSYGFYIEKENKNLSIQAQQLDINVTKFKMLFAQLEGKKKEAEDKLALNNAKLKELEDLITEIKDKRANYFIKSNLLIEIVKFINEYKINLLDFSVSKDEGIKLILHSIDEAEITNFIDKIDEKYILTVEKITLDELKTFYFTEIKLQKR